MRVCATGNVGAPSKVGKPFGTRLTQAEKRPRGVGGLVDEQMDGWADEWSTGGK